MTIIRIVNICWGVFVLYWLISAPRAKRTVRSGTWGTSALLRILALFIVLHLMRMAHLTNLFAFHGPGVTFISSVIVNSVGLILCVTGIALAIWSRWHIGRNWGMPGSLREDHELITSGPYASVRHPIYAGMLLAMIGSVLAGEVWLIIVFPGTFIYFIYNAFAEEKLMTQQFPDKYPAYKQRTKMLVPFVL